MLAVIGWVLLMGGILFWDGVIEVDFAPSAMVTPEIVPVETPGQPPDQASLGVTQIVEQGDPSVFVAPYRSYFITQGPHGFSYGQMAIDISGGKGAAVLSPINGEVTGFYVDVSGNTTLVIENSIYRVLLLHGIYTATTGDYVMAGEQVGVESNQGYTLDMQGNPCWGRDCGYHTHLNVYDKRNEQNVNPLTLMQ